MSNVTVIDPRRGLRPKPAPDAEVLAHLKALQDKAAGKDGLGITEGILCPFCVPAEPPGILVRCPLQNTPDR